MNATRWRPPEPNELRGVLLTQAKLRAVVGIPMTAVWIWLHTATDQVLPWADVGVMIYCSYALVTWIVARTIASEHFTAVLYYTAMADAAVLVFWLPLMEEAAGFIVGLALFTGLGYGLRTGNKWIMAVNQGVTLFGYVLVLALNPDWLKHPVRAISFAVPLIIVPLYVGLLLDRLHAARQKAEEESKAKSDMLAKVSHELRTPLGGIVSAADLIYADAPGGTSGRLANTIIALAKHLQDDIADLLDEAKHSAKALILTPGVCDIRELLGTVEAAVGPKAREKQIDLQVVIDPRLDSASIADAHYLGRALLNLASNAVKFTPSGQVVIRVMVLDSTPNTFNLRFSVEDTGIGIPPEDIDRIFSPFVQLDSGPARRFEGTGLGLSICKDVVELMGGELRVSSAPGRGSRFWFDVQFPRAAVPAAGTIAATATAPVAPISPRRILIVDDNVTNLHLLREILVQDGHTVETADTGQGALDFLAAADPQPDIVVLDYNLGDMDGLEVLQIYRFGIRNPAPVVFLTADTSPDTVARLRQSPAQGVIGKPVRQVELRELLARLLPEKSEQPSGGLRAVPIHYVDADVLAEIAAISKRPEFLREMVERAVQDIERTSKALVAALNEGRWEDARRHAHAVKGVAQQMGAFRLKNLAVVVMETEDSGLESAPTRMASELGEVASNTVEALRTTAAAISAQSGQSVA